MSETTTHLRDYMKTGDILYGSGAFDRLGEMMGTAYSIHGGDWPEKWLSRHRSVHPAVRELTLIRLPREDNIPLLTSLLPFIRKNRTLIQGLPDNVCIFEFNQEQPNEIDDEPYFIRRTREDDAPF